MIEKLKFLVIFIFTFAIINSCASDLRFSKQGSDSTKHSAKFFKGQVLAGECSYYGKKFHGRQTANGEIYDMYKMTAAHKRLPFGTILEIENIANGKKIRVRINDRGPFKPGRIIDLSFAAAKKLDMIKQGTAKIRAVILELGK